MRTDVVKQAALVAAFVGSVAVAGLAGQATAGPASSHQGRSTRDVVEPVWLAVVNADTQFDSAARIELVRAATAKTPADRGRLRDAAAKKLDIAIKHLRRIPTPLPRVLNSAFARARVANLRALGARARRSLTKTNGLGDARRAAEAAARETDLLLDYLTLTVVRITASTNFL